MKKSLSIVMENGAIYVEVHTFHLLEKLAKPLNLQKFLEPIGEETQKMKCYREYMEHVGETKKN